LLICSELNYELRKSLAAGNQFKSDPNSGLQDSVAITVFDCDSLVLELREMIALNHNLIGAGSLKFDAWKAWKSLLVEKLRRHMDLEH